MSEEQLKAFLDKIKGDPSLAEKVNAAKDAEAYVAVAKEAGFELSLEDLKLAQPEVSEAELEGMSGGGDTNHPSQSKMCPTDTACCPVASTQYYCKNC